MLQCRDCYEFYAIANLTERSCCRSRLCDLCLTDSPDCRHCTESTQTVNLAQLNQEITRVHEIAQEQANFYNRYQPHHPNRLADAKAITLHLELLELLQTRLSELESDPSATVRIPLANLTRSLDFYGGELVDSQGVVTADSKESQKFFESHRIYYRWAGSMPRSIKTLKYLKVLSLARTKVTDLTRLAGLELTGLILYYTPVHDITVLQTISILTVLDLSHTKVTDLRPLRDLKLTKLFLGHTAVADISALVGQPLTRLDLSYSKVTDIAALAGMPLSILDLYDVKITDIAVLAGMPLTELDLRQTKVTDYSVVATIGGLFKTEVEGYYHS